MTAAHGALSRQLDGMSFRHTALWALAAFVALSAHAGAGWWLLRETPDEVQIAGAAEISIDMAMLGTAEADQVSSGDALEPVDVPETETVEPVQEVTPTATPPVEQPVEPVEQTQPPETAQAVPPEPVEAQPPIEAPEPSEVQIAAVQPVEPRLAPVEEAKPVEPVEEAEFVPLPEVAPIPEPRPKPKVVEKPKKPDQVVEKKKPPRQRAGNRGQNDSDARRGQAGGDESASRVAAVRQGNGREAGNAAVSNYPGKVASKLRRALPRRSSGGGGEVLVSFRISANGGVSGIRVSRSSGSPAVDKAALDTVRRAAPFPPIPAYAGRSSWDFDLPLTFRR